MDKPGLKGTIFHIEFNRAWSWPWRKRTFYYTEEEVEELSWITWEHLYNKDKSNNKDPIEVQRVFFNAWFNHIKKK